MSICLKLSCTHRTEVIVTWTSPHPPNCSVLQYGKNKCSWCQTLEVLAHTALVPKIKLTWVSIWSFLRFFSNLQGTLKSEPLLCCTELRISLLWTLRVSLCCGMLDLWVCKTMKNHWQELQSSRRGKGEHLHWLYCKKHDHELCCVSLHVCTKQGLHCWQGQKGTGRNWLFVSKWRWGMHWAHLLLLRWDAMTDSNLRKGVLACDFRGEWSPCSRRCTTGRQRARCLHITFSSTHRRERASRKCRKTVNHRAFF